MKIESKLQAMKKAEAFIEKWCRPQSSPMDDRLELLLHIHNAQEKAQQIGEIELAHQLYQVQLNLRCGTPKNMCFTCGEDLGPEPAAAEEKEENPEEHYPSIRDFDGSPPSYPGFDL